MKKRFMMSLMVIGLVSALVGGATFAVFTSDAINTGNTFTAGTVIVSTSGDALTEALVAGNLKPGDSTTGTFVVENDGTLPLTYTVGSATVSGALFTAQDSNGVASDANEDTNIATATVTANGTGTLAPGGSATVTYTVELPLAAGNGFQGKAGTVVFPVSAVQ